MSARSLRSRIGFGCVGLTTLPTEGAAMKLLRAVRETGIDYFDTAPIYGSGYSEILLGKFLRETREPVIVATKFGLGQPQPKIPAVFALPLQNLRRKLRKPVPATPSPQTSPVEIVRHRTITRAEVEQSFNRSRRRLGREFIDRFLLHEGLPSFLEPAAWEFLQDQRRAGTIRQLGVAAGGYNYAALTPADLSGWDVLQYEFGPAWPDNITLPTRFPGPEPVFHSCLKNHAQHGRPGKIIAACLGADPRARVLFSTKNIAHLHANLLELDVE